MFRRHHKKYLAGVVVFTSLTLVIAMFAVIQAKRLHPEVKDVAYGATFSTAYAESLGLDARRTFIAVVDELGIKKIRLPVYWSDVEPSERQYQFEEVDWFVREAEDRGVALTLVVGRKVPRWPECYIPDWAERLAPVYQNQALLDYLENVVRRYDASVAVERWQVENEPFYDFGDCPPPDAKLFDDELALVRRISDKPIQLTTSGENEFWIDTALPADVLGASMYRVTWNPLFGYSVYPLGPDYYAAKAVAVREFVDKVIISELQSEPWLTEPITDSTPVSLAAQFTPKELTANIAFAKQAGFDEIYLWGVEYWYWMAEEGQGALWEAGKKIIMEPAL